MYNSNTSDINGTLMVLSIQEKAWPTRVYQPRLFGVQYSVIYWHCGHLCNHIHIICRGFETLIWRQIKEIKKIMLSVQKKKNIEQSECQDRYDGTDFCWWLDVHGSMQSLLLGSYVNNVRNRSISIYHYTWISHSSEKAHVSGLSECVSCL